MAIRPGWDRCDLCGGLFERALGCGECEAATAPPTVSRMKVRSRQAPPEIEVVEPDAEALRLEEERRERERLAAEAQEKSRQRAAEKERLDKKAQIADALRRLREHLYPPRMVHEPSVPPGASMLQAEPLKIMVAGPRQNQFDRVVGGLDRSLRKLFKIKLLDRDKRRSTLPKADIYVLWTRFTNGEIRDHAKQAARRVVDIPQWNTHVLTNILYGRSIDAE